MQKTALVLLSGGADSTTLVKKLLAEQHQLHALTVLFTAPGYRNREVDFAVDLCRRLDVQHTVLDMSALGVMFLGLETNYAFTPGGCGCDNPDDGKSDDLPPPSKPKSTAARVTASPMTTEMLHTAAAMYALTHNILDVYWAIHADDVQNSKWSKETLLAYLASMEHTTQFLSGNVKFHLPFIEMRKADVIALGI